MTSDIQKQLERTQIALAELFVRTSLESAAAEENFEEVLASLRGEERLKTELETTASQLREALAERAGILKERDTARTERDVAVGNCEKLSRSLEHVCRQNNRLEAELDTIKRELKGFAGEPGDVGLTADEEEDMACILRLDRENEELRASLRKFEGVAAERDEALARLDGIHSMLEAERRGFPGGRQEWYKKAKGDGQA